MNLSLIRSMTRSAVFELENGLCYRPAHPFTVTLNGKTVYEALIYYLIIIQQLHYLMVQKILIGCISIHCLLLIKQV